MCLRLPGPLGLQSIIIHTPLYFFCFTSLASVTGSWHRGRAKSVLGIHGLKPNLRHIVSLKKFDFGQIVVSSDWLTFR